MSIIDTEFILGLFSTEKQTAKKYFEEYISEVNQEKENAILRSFKAINGVTIRQLARLTG